MLNQSRYPCQLLGNVHLCNLKTARTKERFEDIEKYFSPYSGTITSTLKKSEPWIYDLTIT